MPPTSLELQPSNRSLDGARFSPPALPAGQMPASRMADHRNRYAVGAGPRGGAHL